jgi:hypothetical protein
MEFKLKTSEELEKMTTEELNAYQVDKTAFERKQTEELIESKTADLKKQFDSTSTKEEVNKLNDEIKVLTEQVKNFDKTIEDLSKTKTQTQTNMTRKQVIGSQIQKGLDDVLKKAQENGNGSINGYTFTVKDSEFTHTITDVPAGTYPANGSPSNVEGSIFTYNAQNIGGVWASPKNQYGLLNVIDVQRLTERKLFGYIIYNAQGQAEFVEECALKPLVKEDVKTSSVDAKKIALSYKLTEEYQKFVPEFIQNEILSRFEQDLNIRIVEAIFGLNPLFNGITENASTYTPEPSHVVFSSPNHLDAIAVVVNSLELRNYMPSFVMMNPAEKIALINSKATDGHYNVFNNGSIQLVNGVLTYVNGGTYPIIFDKIIPAGKIFVGSTDAFKVASDSDLIIRTGYDADGDLRRNIITVVLEKFMAVYSPAELGEGMIYDDIDLIKASITE